MEPTAIGGFAEVGPEKIEQQEIPEPQQQEMKKMIEKEWADKDEEIRKRKQDKADKEKKLKSFVHLECLVHDEPFCWLIDGTRYYFGPEPGKSNCGVPWTSKVPGTHAYSRAEDMPDKWRLYVPTNIEAAMPDPAETVAPNEDEGLHDELPGSMVDTPDEILPDEVLSIETPQDEIHELAKAIFFKNGSGKLKKTADPEKVKRYEELTGQVIEK